MTHTALMDRLKRFERRNRVVALGGQGVAPRDIAVRVGLPKNTVQRMLREAGLGSKQPVPLGLQVDPMWDLDEDNRRAAIIRRAARGARRTLMGETP